MKLYVGLESIELPIGTLERKADKSLFFSYSASSEEGRLSLSMPVREEPYTDADCSAFFGNLLFEGAELERVRDAHRLDRDDIGGTVSSRC
jgi:serine/threonine-protein kinase HipA